MMTAMIIMHPRSLWCFVCVYAYLMHVYTHYENVPCRRHTHCILSHKCGALRWVCGMHDWLAPAQNSTCPFAWHLGASCKKRVTTLVIFHHTPGPFVRLPAGIMTTMKRARAWCRRRCLIQCGEQMALRPRVLSVSGYARDAKKARRLRVRRTHKSLMAEINHANLISAVELKLIRVVAERESHGWGHSRPTG